MKNLITVDTLIKNAKEKGIDFGKGDPYNRLRYYTKMGWLPHMIRKKDDEKTNVKGHYPSWAISRLEEIENLKDEGLSNEEISKKLNSKNSRQLIDNIVSSNELRIKFAIYTSFLILVVVLASQLGIINIEKPKNRLQATTAGAIQIVQDSGNAYIPSQQKKVFVKTGNVSALSKVYVTFNKDYTPAQRFWVSQINPLEGFWVELDAPVYQNADFSWWITN